MKNLNIVQTTIKGIILLMCVVLAASCSTSTNEQLSCDPAIDSKVKAEFASLRKMDRLDIGMKPIEYQRAYFRGLSAEEKFDLWTVKFNKVLSADWNNRERKHLEKFIAAVDEDLFNKTELELDAFTAFSEAWISESFEEFGWTKENLYYLIATPFEDRKEWKVFLSSSSVAGCGCSTISDWCSGGSGCSSWLDTGCSRGSKWGGCGTMFMYACQGSCTQSIQ